jgi:hypothetical protein
VNAGRAAIFGRPCSVDGVYRRERWSGGDLRPAVQR